eukprot:XP_017950667.1 PREDICTED: traf2 and NCK-interacting protein kinase-like isoform X2 [Xenopus tropicalis]
MLFPSTYGSVHTIVIALPPPSLVDICGSDQFFSLNQEPSVGSGNFVCQEPTEIPGNNNCQEEEPEQELEPAVNIFHETPEFPENNTCQEEDLVEQVSADTSPCQSQESLIESGVPQCNTSEETPKIPDDNICQEEDLIVEVSADTSPCHYQASPIETGTNTSQDEGSVMDLSKEDEQDLKEESGTTTCQPKISRRKRVEPPTNEGNNTISLAKKYPEPGRYFKLGEQIGEDPNGVIYNGWHRSRRVEVAIVIIKDQEKQKGIQTELDVLEMVSGHENIVDFYGAYYHQAPRTPSLPEGLWIATEFITGATLQDLIGTRKTLGERWISYICKQIITGLFHLQKKNVIHHDIKPGNILITSFGEVKIGEFGFATFGGKSSSTSGTITYSAPEVLANFSNTQLEYDHKADIWSLGIAAIEMAEGDLSFSKLSQQKLIEKLTRGPAPSLTPWGKWSDEFRFFISECLQTDPSRRPSARQLLSHPFIGEIRGERGVQKNIAQQLHRGMKH